MKNEEISKVILENEKISELVKVLPDTEKKKVTSLVNDTVNVVIAPIFDFIKLIEDNQELQNKIKIELFASGSIFR